MGISDYSFRGHYVFITQKAIPNNPIRRFSSFTPWLINERHGYAHKTDKEIIP